MTDYQKVFVEAVSKLKEKCLLLIIINEHRKKILYLAEVMKKGWRKYYSSNERQKAVTG